MDSRGGKGATNSEGVKENNSPSPGIVLYPRLPPPPPSPAVKSPLRSNHANSTLLSYGQAKRPSNTPNSSRKRLALQSLINSSPRPGYAQKVQGIFGESVGRLQPLDRSARRKPSCTRHDSGLGRGVRPWSPLQSESGSEPRIEVKRSSSSESIEDRSANAVVEYEEEATRQEAWPKLSGGGAEETPLPPPERTGVPQCPHGYPPRSLGVPQIQEPIPSYDDDSSDSWTGDDEFLPRSADRQKRIDRKILETQQELRTVPSAQLLRPQAPSYTSANYPWPTALSKPSRFRAAVKVPLYREKDRDKRPSPADHDAAELPKSPADATSDHRASDADDEDSNSP